MSDSSDLRFEGLAPEAGLGGMGEIATRFRSSEPERELLNEGHVQAVVVVVVVAVEDNHRVRDHFDPLLLNKPRDGVLN